MAHKGLTNTKIFRDKEKHHRTSLAVSLFNSDNSVDEDVVRRSNCLVSSCCSAYCRKQKKIVDI